MSEKLPLTPFLMMDVFVWKPVKSPVAIIFPLVSNPCGLISEYASFITFPQVIC